MHAAAFEAVGDDGFAGALDDASGDAEVRGAELGVLHAEAVAGDVVAVLAGIVAGVCMAVEGGEEEVDAALVEFVAALSGPGGGEVGRRAVDGYGDVAEVLFGVEDVHDLDGLGKCSSARFQIKCCVQHLIWNVAFPDMLRRGRKP